MSIAPSALAILLLLLRPASAAIPQTALPLVSAFTTSPSPWLPTDWAAVARAQTAFVFSANSTGPFLPLLFWDDARANVNFTTFGTPSYVGGAVGAGAPHESIAGAALVLSGLLVGAPMTNLSGGGFEGVDTERMLLAYLDRSARIWVDTLHGAVSGANMSFWYAAWASMLPLQVAAASGSGTLLPGIRAAAATWLRVQAALRNDFNVSSVAFAPDGTPLPTRGDARSYPLPVVSAGVAWLLYASRAALGEGDAGAPALLRGATDALDYLFALPYDSYWEVLMPFGALASARVNAEQGARYDTAQLLNNILQPGLPAHFPFRWGWGTLAGAWGEPPVDVAGLTGASSDRGGYGFAFDTFATLSALVPVARYEAQFARALGRYASNAANAARLFFPFANAADAQSDAGWVASAGAGAQALAYEGVRRWGFNATDANITGPYATGDGKSQDKMPTNLAVYGGAYVGLMAALVLPTADEGVAAFDARATDWWARDGYPTTLLYNGRGAPVETLLALPARSAALFDVYDAVSQAVVARNVTPPSVSVTLGPDEAAVLVAYPAGLPLVRDDAHNWLLAGGIVVDWQLVPRGGTAGREQ